MIILNFLKSKIGISVILFLAIVGVALGAKYHKPSSENKPKDAATIAVEQIANQLLTRENEDGSFKTWEELYGTSTSATSTDSSKPSPKYTSTDLFSQELFKEYLAKKQSGQDITQDVSDSIAADVLAKSYPTEGPSMIQEKDVQTVPTTYTGLVRYGNDLIKTVTIPLPAGYSKSELELLQDIANNPSLLGTIDFKPFEDRYLTIKQNLLAMKVPADMSKAHANIVNGISNILLAVDGMMNLTTDPIGGMGKTAAYEIGLQLLDVGYSQAQAVMKDKGVQFSPDEPAYAFFN